MYHGMYTQTGRLIGDANSVRARDPFTCTRAHANSLRRSRSAEAPLHSRDTLLRTILLYTPRCYCFVIRMLPRYLRCSLVNDTSARTLEKTCVSCFGAQIVLSLSTDKKYSIICSTTKERGVRYRNEKRHEGFLCCLDSSRTLSAFVVLRDVHGATVASGVTDAHY